jgi:hypothetical protein
MELFTTTGKLNFLQLEIFDVYTTGDTAHIDTIFKLLPHTRHHGDACVAVWLCVTVNISIKIGPLTFLL